MPDPEDIEHVDDSAAEPAEDTTEESEVSTEEETTEEPEEETGEEVGEPEGEPEEPVKPTRGETRQQKLANELREERERRIRAEALAEERSRTKPAVSASAEDAARQRAEKLALMEPEEKRAFLLQEKIDKMEQDQILTKLQMQDGMDKSAYDAKATLNPIYAKHAAKVEEKLAEMRRGGMNAPRETVLRYLIGEEALSSTAKKKPASAKKAAAERVAGAKTKPVSARSDATGKKSSGGDESLEDLETRLKNVML